MLTDTVIQLKCFIVNQLTLIYWVIQKYHYCVPVRIENVVERTNKSISNWNVLKGIRVILICAPFNSAKRIYSKFKINTALKLIKKTCKYHSILLALWKFQIETYTLLLQQGQFSRIIDSNIPYVSTTNRINKILIKLAHINSQRLSDQ